MDSVKHETITDVSKSHLIELNGLLVDHDCHDCLQGKATHAYAIVGSKDKYTTTVPFSMVYSDVCQIARSRFRDRPQYIVSFKCAVTHAEYLLGINKNVIILYFVRSRSNQNIAYNYQYL